MSLGKDIIDIYTKSSVYYLRLQYLVVCYLIVLAGAFFVLPLPREMGINGNARLIVGGLLYIGFAVLLVYAPKLLKSSVGKFLSPDENEQEVYRVLNQVSEKKRKEVEKGFYKKGKLPPKKKHIIATNIFFQCLLIELFCLTVLINIDHSLLVSNSITQNIADILSNHVEQTHKDGNFFSISTVETGIYFSFSQYAYMAESIFFIYIVSMISCFIEMMCLFVFIRPILIQKEVFSIITNANSFRKIMWAILGTIIMAFITVGFSFYIIEELYPHLSSILNLNSWVYRSILFRTIAILNVLFFFRFIEDWFKKMIGLI